MCLRKSKTARCKYNIDWLKGESQITLLTSNLSIKEYALNFFQLYTHIYWKYSTNSVTDFVRNTMLIFWVIYVDLFYILRVKWHHKAGCSAESSSSGLLHFLNEIVFLGMRSFVHGSEICERTVLSLSLYEHCFLQAAHLVKCWASVKIDAPPSAAI